MMIAVAIDGPAGAGKSTIAKKAAHDLGFIYVDTGALYRAVGLNFINTNTGIKDEAAVGALLAQTNIELKFINGEQRVLLNGEDVSDVIRTPKASMMASDVSALPPVRAFLLDLQQNIAQTNNVIMDGRDIGTVVLPNAQVKIFLTASAKCRAKRRYNQLKEAGQEADFDSILNDIEIRDYNDSHRDIAPLKPAADSILVDTSDEELEDSLARLISLINEKLNN
ncbi:cytidylate kinase [Clostridia bacterium]|nr:cytidylate kinase [Clostridia bacterium]